MVLIAEAKELVFAYGNSLTEKGDYCNEGFNYKGIFNYTCSMGTLVERRDRNNESKESRICYVGNYNGYFRMQSFQ